MTLVETGVAEGTGIERAERYMALAARMEGAAEHASHPSIAAAYLELAGKWLRLAEQAAKDANPTGELFRGEAEPISNGAGLHGGWSGR